MKVVFRPWSRETETAELAEGDIGIAYMPDDSWSLGKCGLKVLQYMAAGLPVVANPVGVHREMIVHGETGFLADTPERVGRSRLSIGLPARIAGETRRGRQEARRRAIQHGRLGTAVRQPPRRTCRRIVADVEKSRMMGGMTKLE